MSMLLAQAQTKQIGPCSYEVLPLPAGVSLRALARVLRMVGPTFADVSSVRQAASAFGRLLASGLTDLDEEVVLYLTAELAKVTQVVHADGRKVAMGATFDEHFRGRLPDLFAWLKFSAEVTYGPLGEALRGMMPMISPESAPPAKPDSPSTA